MEICCLDMGKVAAVIRVLCILTFFYSISQRDGDHWPESRKSRNQYGGHCRFLTFLNVCLSIFTSALYIVGDFSKKGKGSRFLESMQYIHDEMFLANKIAGNLAVSLSLPVSLVVFTSFWGIYVSKTCDKYRYFCE